MQIGASNPTSLGLSPKRHSSAAAENSAEPRANLPAVIEPQHMRSTPSPVFRPNATLIAQLVAGREDLASARALRREDPAIGTGAYRAVAALAPSPESHEQRTI